MTKNAKLFVLAIIACLFTGCAGMTAAEVGTVAVTGAGALVGFIEALRPMLSPEQAANLTAIAGDIDTVVHATTTAIGEVATAIGEVKAQQEQSKAGSWTSGEITAAGGGLTAVAVAGSRILSAIKHRERGAKATVARSQHDEALRSEVARQMQLERDRAVAIQPSA